MVNNHDRFPGIAEITARNVYRSLGDSGSRERFGIGFINKSGVEYDFVDYTSPYYVIVYVLRGNGLYIDSRGKCHPLRSGSFFQRVPGELHSNLIDPASNWVECFIDIGTELAEYCRKIRLIRNDFRVGHIGLDFGVIDRIWGLRHQLESAGEDEPQQLLPEILSLIAWFHRRRGEEHDPDRKMVDTACAFLGRNYDQRTDIAEFCRGNGWGYESFRKKFKERTGLSPGQYRIRCRIDTASSLLGRHDITINDIAFRLGYKSPYEFSAQFKRVTGVSPANFRHGKEKKHQQNP